MKGAEPVKHDLNKLKKVLKNYLKKVDNRQPFHYYIKCIE